LVRMHKAICQNPELFSQLGGELLLAEQRVRRFCLAQRIDWSYVRALTAAMLELEQHGFAFPRSRLKRVLDWFLGAARAEWLELLSYFLFERKQYYFYANGTY
jgi:hypothetical protein